MNKLKRNDLIKARNFVIFLGLSMISTPLIMVGNLKVIVLIYILRNYS